MKGVVYFIRARDKDLFKIGQSVRSANQRLREFQTGCPYELEVYGVIETDEPYDLEQSIHAQLKEYQQRGEWFSIPTVIADTFLLAKSYKELFDTERLSSTYDVPIIECETPRCNFRKDHSSKVHTDDMPCPKCGGATGVFLETRPMTLNQLKEFDQEVRERRRRDGQIQ